MTAEMHQVRVRPPDPGGKNELSYRKQRSAESLEQDMLKVKAENVTLYGRLRGYKTLEQMYSQSKEEANTYKRLYEEMLTKDSGKMDNEQDQMCDFPSGTGQFVSELGRNTTDANDMEITNDDETKIIMLSGDVTTDAAAGEGDSQHDSDAEEAPTSFQMGSHDSTAPQGNIPSAQQSMDSHVQSMDSHVMEESIRVSQPHSRQDHPEELNVDIPNHGAASHSPSLSPDSMNLQAQLMSIIKSDHGRWKQELGAMNEKVRLTTEENEHLRQENARMIDLEREVNHLRAHPEREGSPSSSAGDWVHVANERARETETPAGATGGESDDISPTQKAKIQKMQQKMAKLHRANREWEEHCKQLTDRHKLDHAKLKKKLADEVGNNALLKEHEQLRQREVESLVNSIHRQRTEQEVTLERDLHLEKQRSASYLERCLELEREANNWREQDDRRNMIGSMTSPVRASSATIDSLKTEIEVLKLQVMTYKEDFDTERKDREKILREKTEFQETIRNVLDENDVLRSEMSEKTSEIGRISSQVGTKNEEIADLKQKIQSLEQQVRGTQTHYGVPTSTQRPVPPTAPGYYGSSYAPPPPHHWLCRRCSYRNEGERSFCEMCGNVKYNQYDYQYPHQQLVPHGNGPSPVNTGPAPAYPQIGMSNRPGDLHCD